jgi:hypothetical protein
MKKVLYIDYTFPPLASDFRGAALARFLPEFGWQPIIVSASERVTYDKDYDLLKQVPVETQIHRLWHKELLSKEWRYLLDRLKVHAEFPDSFRSWYTPALIKAREIMRKDKVELIHSASPPFTTALVAMKLKRDSGIPWVADFQDGWAVNDFLDVYYREALLKPLYQLQKFRIMKGEGDILRSADTVLTASWHVAERLAELHGTGTRRVNISKIEVVNLGYDEYVFEGLVARPLYPGRLTIVFLGSFYSPFKEPVIEFVNAVREIEEAEVVFIGRGAAAMQAVTKAEATYILNLPRKKALAFALGSDFLFVVMPPYAKWIPAKIYDYLRLGKPILALVPEDGDTARIVKEAKGGFVLSYEMEEMKRQLKSIFEKWRQGKFKDFHPDWEYVAQFERRKLVQKMAAIFDEVAAQRSDR